MAKSKRHAPSKEVSELNRLIFMTKIEDFLPSPEICFEHFKRVFDLILIVIRKGLKKIELFKKLHKRKILEEGFGAKSIKLEKTIDQMRSLIKDLVIRSIKAIRVFLEHSK